MNDTSDTRHKFPTLAHVFDLSAFSAHAYTRLSFRSPRPQNQSLNITNPVSQSFIGIASTSTHRLRPSQPTWPPPLPASSVYPSPSPPAWRCTGLRQTSGSHDNGMTGAARVPRREANSGAEHSDLHSGNPEVQGPQICLTHAYVRHDRTRMRLRSCGQCQSYLLAFIRWHKETLLCELRDNPPLSCPCHLR